MSRLIEGVKRNEEQIWDWWHQRSIAVAQRNYLILMIVACHENGWVADPRGFNPAYLRYVAGEALKMAAIFIPPPGEVLESQANTMIDAVVAAFTSFPRQIDYGRELVYASQLTLVPHLELLAAKKGRMPTENEAYLQARSILLTYNQKTYNLRMDDALISRLTDLVVDCVRNN